MAKEKLSNTDYCRAAERLNCEVAAIKAVAIVESKGNGFDTQDRPKILFERHKFAKYTNGKYVTSHPDICNWTPGGYGTAASQYDRYGRALILDAQAAMFSASWGKFQIMGFNFAICGYRSVQDFVDDMRLSEGAHLDAFVEYVVQNELADELRNKDWAGFAKGYNGPDYKINQYDTKMADAYKQCKTENIDCSKVVKPQLRPVMRFGDSGNDVRSMQECLVTELLLCPGDVDGNFGPRTEMAVKAFQSLNKMTVDGIVGKNTRKALMGI
ncbi:MAG: N-acetylmuramidase domain-containing protein [Pyrinomonadaceae bacterium]